MFYRKVKKYIKEHQLVAEGDRVIIGLSGGPDSVCLAILLDQMKEALGIRLAAVHVNHMLRGKAADADEAFVRDFCRELKIPLTVVREDVAAYAKTRGLSQEEAGRMIRREAFEKAAAESGAPERVKIALAHHMEDQAETVLFHLSRGTGIAGLAGIRPKSGWYIHPLLSVHKEEILKFLAEEDAKYCEDHTNREDSYTRNRIRNHVIPYLNTEVNTNATEHITALAQQAALADAYIHRQAERLYDRCVTEDAEGIHMETAVWQAEDEIVKTCMVRLALARAAGAKKDIESVHIRDICSLFEKSGEKRIDLPYGLMAVKDYREVLITKRRDLPGKNDPDNRQNDLKNGHMEGINGHIEMRIIKRSELPVRIENLPYTKWFDYAIIPHNVSMRTRLPGDYLAIDRMGHTQTLKKYMINEKIPKKIRDSIPLVAAGDEVLWIIGYRQNPKYQISEQTETVLEVIFREETSGRE